MKEVKYMLRGVTIEQFATLFEPSSDNVEINLSIPIMTNYLEHSVAVGANAQFVEGDKVFMIAEVFCHYLIEPGCWEDLSKSDTKDVTLPKAFVNNLAGIAISSARGVLCAKTERTPFAKYYLPLAMVSPDQGEDLRIPKPE